MLKVTVFLVSMIVGVSVFAQEQVPVLASARLVPDHFNRGSAKEKLVSFLSDQLKLMKVFDGPKHYHYEAEITGQVLVDLNAALFLNQVPIQLVERNRFSNTIHIDRNTLSLVFSRILMNGKTETQRFVIETKLFQRFK